MSKAKVVKMTVSLDPRNKDVLTRLSVVMGLSRSACLNQLLTGVNGPLEAIIEQLGNLQKLNQKQREEFAAEFALVEKQAMGIQAETAEIASAFVKLMNTAKFHDH